MLTILPLVRQQRPDDSGILVSQHHRCNILVAPRPDFVEMVAQLQQSARLLAVNDDAGTVNHEGSQVRVTTLG